MKHNRIHPLALLLPLVTACAASPRLSPDEAQAVLAEDARIFSSDAFRDVDQLAPQLDAPFRLAIAPRIERFYETSSMYYGRGGDYGPSLRPWSAAERAVMEEHLDSFVASGVLSEYVWMPSLLIDATLDGTWLENVRHAALRERADAVLIVHSVDMQTNDPNLLAILDFTIVGGFFVPGHDLTASTALGAMLFDTRNEYLYMTAMSDTEVESTAAVFRLDARARKSRDEARIVALEQVAEELAKKGTRLVTEQIWRRPNPTSAAR